MHVHILSILEGVFFKNICNLHFNPLVHGFLDPTNNFIVKKMLEGKRRDNPIKDSRLPITATVLEKRITTLHFLSSNMYKLALFTAVYLVSYFGFMRVSEVTVDSKLTYHKDLELSRVSDSVF